jgi:hypothetical protein
MNTIEIEKRVHAAVEHVRSRKYTLAAGAILAVPKGRDRVSLIQLFLLKLNYVPEIHKREVLSLAYSQLVLRGDAEVAGLILLAMNFDNRELWTGKTFGLIREINDQTAWCEIDERP